MLKILHEHLNSPNTSASIIIPILRLGWWRQRGLGIRQDTDRILPVLPPWVVRVLYRFLYFTLNILQSPRKHKWYISVSLQWLLCKLCHFESYMANIKVTINMKSMSEAQD